MRVVTHAALVQNRIGMRRMYFRKTVPLMTIEAAALESKPAVLVYLMTLRALDIRKRRMLVKRRETGWRVAAGEKPDLLLPAVP